MGGLGTKQRMAIYGALAGALALGGCGGGSGTSSPLSGGGGGSGSDAAVQPTSGDYEPLAVGLSWTYHVNDNGVSYDKTSAVIATEDAGGQAPDRSSPVYW